jgi:peptidylprolyl isomerase
MKWISRLGLILTLFITPAFTEENEPMQKTHPVVKIETTAGSFEVTLFPEVAPKACENFLKLAEKKYYDGTIFHRVIPGFMIQGGDPQGTGAGGQSIWGKPFEDECTNDFTFDKPGLLAMANAGPKTNGSQFFITTASTAWLNMKHTIFGQVTQGYEVVKKIEKVGTQSGRPSEKIQIVKITTR